MAVTIIKRFIIFFLFVVNLFAGTEVSLHLKLISPEFSQFKTKILAEPLHTFLGHPNYIYRVGSRASRQLILRETRPGEFYLYDGDKEIGKASIALDQPEKLGTFVRMSLYKHFHGKEKYQADVKAKKIIVATKSEYKPKPPPPVPVILETPAAASPVLVAKKENELKSLEKAPQETAILESQIADNEEKLEADKRIPQEKINDKTARGTKNDGPGFFSRLFAEDKFPLLIGLGMAFGGPVTSKENKSTGNGMEFQLGIHFSKGITTKYAIRNFTAKGPEGEVLFKQNTQSFLLLKNFKTEIIPMFISLGYAKEKLEKPGFDDSMVNKALLGFGITFSGFVSVEVREEYALKDYAVEYKEETKSKMIPVVLISVGYQF